MHTLLHDTIEMSVQKQHKKAEKQHETDTDVTL